MYVDYIWKWLDAALDCGIKEYEFWDMTIAELNRAIESRNRVKKAQDQERASYDYILAELIGRAISLNYSKSATFPEIHEVYPTLFDREQIEEVRQVKQSELFALRIKQFAASHNKKFKEVASVNG